MYGVVSHSHILSMILNSIFLKKYEKRVNIQCVVGIGKKVLKSVFFCLCMAELSDVCVAGCI